VTINGESQRVDEGETLGTLLLRMGLSEKPVVCEVDLTIVSRDDWSRTVLCEGAQIEIIGFVGGGALDLSRNQN
jgi:sulfur carrier protein